ncbi:N-acetylmuramoyl-L-alanine amidase [Maritalea mediterranea]|uniref:N-acetylmuramoyl-L-alanine amidase n=1 Tax=Maritalea mediterranea TaxID=2909667 RepID=A0ABS9EDJ8_9HYPH|nr:N-acetylmuramoyl-L-alanine amidase [Maritalea mediterranea]MCF4099840.1 N-acetylmuramoyl-L-alanine amidase [Maritalea mediterranea]
MHKRILVHFLTLILLPLLLMGPVQAQENIEILDARLAVGPDKTRLVVDLSGAAGYATFPIDQPDRLVVELGVEKLADDAPTELKTDGLVKETAIGMVDEGRARIVMFLTKPVQVTDIQMLEAVGEQPARLVVEIAEGERAIFDQAVAQSKALLTGQAGESAPQEDAETPDAPQEPGALPSAVTVRPLILLDPGHGGIDGGARAENGLEEKHVVLEFAKRVQEELLATGKFDVALTRTGDEFLSLEERVELARENKASLMISLHADSFGDPNVRGASVYTRDESATDVLDKVLAEGENKVDLIAGFDAPEESDQVVNILVDLMRRETRRQSFMAARDIVNEIEDDLPMRPYPLRRADFFVLQSPEVPSILLELGFLSNGLDMENLAKPDWQNKAAKALAQGIVKYFDAAAQN